MGMEDEVGRHAMVAADKSKKEGIEEVLTAVLDLPQARGVKAVPKISKQRPAQNAGIVARRDIRRASVGRSASIRRNPDPDLGRPNKEIGNSHTMQRIIRIRESWKGAKLHYETRGKFDVEDHPEIRQSMVR